MARVPIWSEEKGLLPCPFCGSISLDIQPYADLGMIRGSHIWQLARVYCQACSAGGAQVDTEEEAIKAWNTRTYPDPTVTQRNTQRLIQCLDRLATTGEYERKIEREYSDGLKKSGA